MKTKKFELKEEDRIYLKEFTKKGNVKAREISRARALLLLDKGKKHFEIAEILDINPKTVGRFKKRYMEEGLESVLHDKPRPGQPKKYTDKQEAKIIALVCTDPPEGMKRWTLRRMTEHLKSQEGFETINRESIRLILKKRCSTMKKRYVVYKRDR